MGRYVLGVVALGGWRLGRKGLAFSASYFEWTFSKKCPNSPNEGLRLPFSGDGLYRFESLRTFSACKAVVLGDAMGGRLPGPEKSIIKSRANWGHASATQLRRVLVDSEGGNMHSVNSAGEVLEQCDVCRFFAKAPHVPTR